VTGSTQHLPEKLGRYEIVNELGRGAMGVVYEGTDPNIGRRVAIKTARRDVLEGSGRAEEMMERFLREARAAGALNHPNIITIYDAGEQDGMAYIAMEFIQGSDLQEIIDDKKRFDLEDVIEIGTTICEALGHAHEKGIVHRDVKPANIMRVEDGTLRIADFGIARVSNSSLTQEGAMIGTPHYMSPEQFMGQKVDGRSDLFSVAIILYELLTGEKPFPGEALNTVMHGVIRTNPIEPKELNFSINPTLSQVVMRSLSKDPNQRYATGSEMAAALKECLKENPDPAVTGLQAPAVAEDLGATIATGDADLDKTQVVSPAPPAESLPTETIARPPAAAETVHGEPDFVKEETQGKKDTAPQADAPHVMPKTGSPLVPVAVVAAVLAVVAVAAFTLYGGGGSNQQTIGFYIYLADDLEAASQNPYSKSIPEGCIQAEGATVLIYESDPSNPLFEEKTAGGIAAAEFRTSQDTFTYEISMPGYNKQGPSVYDPAARPSDQQDIRHILLKE
jgi:serine/threonine-protein kinase